MRFHIPYGVLALLLGALPAQAQTVITGPMVAQPARPVIAAPRAVVQPVETVRTIRTVHTVHRLVPVRERIVTTHTITRRVEPVAPAVIAGPVAAPPTPVYDTAVTVAAPAPLYDTGVPVAAPGPFYDTAASVPAPAYGYTDYSAPLYDVAPAAIVPAPAIAPAPFVAPVASAPVIYRYVYEPGRILVIDPTTNIAVQAIPR